MTDAAALEGWVPIRAIWGPRGPELDWCFLGERAFTEPFFDETVRVMLRDPYHRDVTQRTPIAALETLHTARPGLPLGGIIFHVSRCGSTLLARVLAATPEHVVISEAPPIDELLNTARRGVGEAQRITWLRALVSALCQPRTGQETRAFIKLDSWHIHELPLIRQAFPDVPWLIVYRDPVEVLVSHQRLRGSQMIPGQIAPERLGLTKQDVGPPFDFDAFCARVLGGFYTAAAHAFPQQFDGLLLNYAELPDALWSRVLPHFGVAVAEPARAALELELEYHAKQPAHPFRPDSQLKQQAASAALRTLAEHHIAGPYQTLEMLRQLQLASESL